MIGIAGRGLARGARGLQFGSRAAAARVAPAGSRPLSSENGAYPEEEEEYPLRGTKSQQSLKKAFAQYSMNSVRYQYFAEKADAEGEIDAASDFRAVQKVASSLAMGHLEFLEEAGDPLTDEPFGSTDENVDQAIASAKQEHESLCPQWAEIANKEDQPDVADWFEQVNMASEKVAAKLQFTATELASMRLDNDMDEDETL